MRKRRWLIVMTILGVLAAGGYGGVCYALYKYQNKLIFIPHEYFHQDPSAAGLEFEEFEIEVDPSATVTGWIVRTNEDAPWVLHFHGNAGNISGRVDHLKLLSGMGFNTVVFDYRGYGKSKGEPTEAGLVADGLAVVKYLSEELGVNKRRLVYYGESLGGGVAAAVAEVEPPRAMIFKSTFTSMTDRAAESYPFLPVRWLAKTRFETKERVKNFLFPKLVIHSRPDTVIPYHHGQRLFQLCPEPKKFLEFHRGHNTSPLELGDQFEQTVYEFITESVPSEY